MCLFRMNCAAGEGDTRALDKFAESIFTKANLAGLKGWGGNLLRFTFVSLNVSRSTRNYGIFSTCIRTLSTLHISWNEISLEK